LIGRIDTIWENADNFIPERFELDNLKGKHSCAFIPFGAGPRNCE
jgi:cytochrome P450